MDAAQQMDKQYRYQRYVYDFSRKYYLLGRDSLLQEIPLAANETLLEIGCGTARNLVKLAYRSPAAKLYGIDASSMMLETARAKLQGTLYERNITLKQGLAGQITHQHFGLEQPFDHIVFSYVLSMIPHWQTALEHALQMLKPGGYIHVVDFSDQQAMPVWFRNLLMQWLDWFHVHPDPAVPAYLTQLAQRTGQLRIRQLAGRYAVVAHYQKEGESLNDDQSAQPQIPQYLDF